MKQSLYVLMLCCLFFCSCIHEPEKASVVISNNSESVLGSITQVWTRVENSNDWVSQWTGSKKQGEDVNLYIEPGTYDFRIEVTYLYLVPLKYETGYKNSITCKRGEYKFIFFDGKGIFDMEKQ